MSGDRSKQALKGDYDHNQPALKEDYDATIRPKIDLVDQLRMDGLNTDVPLPQIVVIGDQSSGKSSTLEALSGIQLPRGSTLTTRAPLAMVLRQSMGTDNLGHSCTLTYRSQPGSDVREDIDEFEMEDLGERIRKAQDVVRGNAPITDQVITLRIVKPNTPDLSLVDLPGIARMVKGQGHQSFNIAETTLSLIKKFVENKDTIILVVLPCNVDIATCEAMKVAQEVDPTGERTLGVLTKADLVPEGAESDIVDIVNNREWRLKKGYTVIRCRTHKEMQQNISLEEARRREDSFFKNHPLFRSLPSSRKGIKSLSRTLTKELAEHIKKRLPNIRKSVHDALKATKSQLDQLGDDIPKETLGRRNMLAQMCKQFSDDMRTLSSGERPIKLQGDQQELNMRRDMRALFDNFHRHIKKITPGADEATVRKIDKIRRRQRGRELPSFIRYSGCEEYIKDLVERCRPFADDLLEKSNDLVDTHITQVVDHHFVTYPGLGEKIMELVNTARDDARARAAIAIEELFEMEGLVHTADVFYLHEEKGQEGVIRSTGAVYVAQEPKAPGTSFSFSTIQQKEENPRPVRPPTVLDAASMLASIRAYYNIACRRLSDTVPMAILLHVVQKLSERIQDEVLVLPSDNTNLDFLREDSDRREEREELEAKMSRLNKARARLAAF